MPSGIKRKSLERCSWLLLISCIFQYQKCYLAIKVSIGKSQQRLVEAYRANKVWYHSLLLVLSYLFFKKCKGKMYPSDELKANKVNGQSTDKRSLVHSQVHGEYQLITVKANATYITINFSIC